MPVAGWYRRRREQYLRKLSPRGPDVAYMAMFAAGDGIRTSPTGTSAYPGLVAYHGLSSRGRPAVVTYWRDEEHYRAYGPHFQADASLGRSLNAGYVTHLAIVGERFWKRYSWKQAVLTTAALFGAFSAFRDHFSTLFAKPMVAVSFADVGTVDGVEGTDLSIPLTLLNEVRFATARVQAETALARPKGSGTATRLHFDAATIPALAPGQTSQIRIYGTLPSHSGRGRPPDEYDLEVSMSAEAGMLFGRVTLPPLIKRVKVWSRALTWRNPYIIEAGRSHAILETSVYAGAACFGGIQGHVILSSPETEISDLDLDGLSIREKHARHGNAGALVTRKISFRTGPLEKFKPWRLLIALDGASEITRSRWEQIAKSLDVHFQE